MVASDPSIPVLAVQGEGYNSPNIVDPSLVVGASLDVTVGVANLPKIIDNADGGIQGFDITLTYNSSILRPELTAFSGPFCPSTDDCLWTDLTQRQTLTFANQTDTMAGTLRIGLLVYDPAYRTSLNGTLFKVGFLIVGLGITTITVDQSSSFLIGFALGCGSAITNYQVDPATLDNRPPWKVTANPPSATVSPNGIARIQVNVTRVNSDANVTLIFPSGGLPFNYSFSPRTGLLDIAAGKLSFSSVFTLGALATAPPMTYYTIQLVAHDTFSPGGYREYRLNYTVFVDPPSPNIVEDQHSSSMNAATTPASSNQSVGASDPVLPLVANFTYTVSATSVTFAAVACGGTPPFTYTWDFGDGKTGSTGAIAHDFSGYGSYSVTLKVRDTTGHSFTATQTVTVSSGFDVLFYVSLFGLGLLVTLVVGTIILRRRR